MSRGQEPVKKYKYATEGAVLREIREAANLTQKDVSDHLGYTSPQFISNTERGICRFPVKNLKLLGKLYGKKQILRVIDLRVNQFRLRLLKGI